MYRNYQENLEDFTDAQVADVLDVAAAIKRATIEQSRRPGYAGYFGQPLDAPRREAFRVLRLWRHQMISEAGSEEGHAKIAGLMVWYLSLAAGQFPHFQARATSLWQELARGFGACRNFDPAIDVPAGFSAAIPQQD